MKLFGHYARGVQPSFLLTAANAATVVAICMRLDGLPLALKLAAVRVRWFTPDALLARLTLRSLPELVSGRRDASLRQQTLRNTIAWSHDLLPEAEQRLFARFAVFVGGATAAALVAVDGTGAEERAQALAEQSLLTVETSANGTPRYGM